MATGQRTDKPHQRPGQLGPLLDRQPPCDVEAEQFVLGSVLILPDKLDDVVLVLRPDDFYDDANQCVYSCMKDMHDAGRKIDAKLVAAKLKDLGYLDRIGGLPYLAQLANSVPTAAHAAHYAQVVQETARRRALIHACTDILQDAYQSGKPAHELLSQAEQQIFAILEGRATSSITDVKQALLVAMERLDARLRGDASTDGVETGFMDLDGLLGGLHTSELVILAARPSMGKTALAMNIAEHVSLHQQVGVLFVSLEMASSELVDRLLCSVARVNGRHLRNGSISNKDRDRLVEKADAISEAPLFIDDSPSRTVSEIAAAARRIQRSEKSLGLIVIDYLQLIEPDNSSDPRQEQVAKIARRLKGLAREMKLPVLCLAQLNRQAEASRDNRPRLSHLRESGAIEQDADVVMFVHREEYYRTEKEREEHGQRPDQSEEAEVIISKQRNGPVGIVDLLWQKEYTRFANVATRAYDEFESYGDGDGNAF